MFHVLNVTKHFHLIWHYQLILQMYMRKIHAQYVEKWSLNMKQIDILGKEYSMIWIRTTTPGPLFMIKKYCSMIKICTTIPVVRLRDGT